MSSTKKGIPSVPVVDMNLKSKQNTSISEITLILPGTIRSKKNSRQVRNQKTKTGKLIKFMGKSDTYIEWETRARQAAIQQLQKIQIDKTLSYKLEVKAYMKGNLCDLDAVHTSVMDCLQGIVWENDKQVKQFSEQSGVWTDSAMPRTEVVITETRR